jgi:hypothetical protein
MYQVDDFPEFLKEYLPKCLVFVDSIKKNFVNSSKEQLDKFAKHLLVSFYFEHGEVTRLDSDLNSLLNENKGHDSERDLGPLDSYKH